MQVGPMPEEVQQNQPRPSGGAAVYPEEVQRLLSSEDLSEDLRQTAKLGAQMMSAFISQALGGGYTYNLDGTPTWNKSKRTSSEKAKFSAILKRDPSAIRNDINVSAI